jgi:hypothetical protein
VFCDFSSTTLNHFSLQEVLSEIYHKCTLVFKSNNRYSYQILTKVKLTDRFSKNLQMSNLIKFVQWQPRNFIQTAGQKYIMKLTVVCRNFATARRNVKTVSYYCISTPYTYSHIDGRHSTPNHVQFVYCHTKANRC